MLDLLSGKTCSIVIVILIVIIMFLVLASTGVFWCFKSEVVAAEWIIWFSVILLGGGFIVTGLLWDKSDEDKDEDEDEDGNGTEP